MQTEINALQEKIQEHLTKEQSQDYLYLQNTVEKLKYFDREHECDVLFRMLTSTAYALTVIGDDWKAFLLILWASELAEESTIWTDEEDEDDYTNGYWGYS